ncbi:MATH and LRR domain-containing protein PFE0570w-like [Odontomachus brunneus]|uniref:MATH and LRR domain-containing protein PFE0570w-like n=1 Tax=Odontomachus brunneus TaxID=486640 RepID=UPI0013F23A00|nr:MATH and LRR domain-containing protein PFE0570w-like [Odontomachus brunneus]
MSRYCFLCASDEGVFLEVTSESVRAAFSGQIEACLSKKVNQTIELSNKICYKCAYELDQCSKFLQKSQKSQDSLRIPKATLVPYCSLCCEPVESGHIFDITEDNRSIFSPLQKIRKIFTEDLSKKVSHFKLVCLVCRYNLDVLYDLKKLHEQTVNNLENLINKELDYSSFPKVYTDVVNRKTTITTFPDTTLYELVSSGNESDDEMARGKSRGKLRGKPRKNSVKKSNTTKSQNNAKLKRRSCDQCNNVVENGMDMYRLYHTGQTVCRNCWITTDPNKGRSRRNSNNRSMETKLCTVYLKDVLNVGSHNNDNTHKEIKSDKEKDKDDELNISSDQSSQNEDKNSPKMLLRERKPTANGSSRRGGRKRRINSAKSDAESMPFKRQKASVIVHKKSTKALSDLDQPSTSFERQQGRKRKDISDKDWSTDSEHSQKTSVTRNKTKRSLRRTNHLMRVSSASEEDDAYKTVAKRQKPVIMEAKNVGSESNDESSNEASSKSSKKKAKVIASMTLTRSRTRSSSISSKEMTPPPEFKSPKIIASQEYPCDKCDKKFNTKLTQAQHKLTHGKQLTLNLERISIPSIEEEQESKVDVQENRTDTEEAKASTSGTELVDRNSTDLSEEIVINVGDEKQQQKDDQMEKPKAKENESHQEDESLKIQVDEEAIAKEPPQCGDSTTVFDETATEVADDMNEDTVLIDEGDTTEDQDDYARKDNVTVVENLKMSDGEKEDEDTTIEDDTKKTSAAERETECNKDLDDEIKLDNEKTESSISPTAKNNKDNTVEHNNDYDKNLENNLENNHKDDKNARTKDADVTLSVDLTNDSQEEDPKESEEKIFTADSETLEILDDKENSVIDYPKKQHKEIDKKDEEVTDVDKYDDSTDSTIKPNLLNCEILDELENKDVEEQEEEDDDVMMVNVADSNDVTVVQSKEVTEETVATNDLLTEEATPTEDVNDLEQLMGNNECELRDKREKYENSLITSTDTATKIMEEVFDLAAVEVQKRKDGNGIRMNSDEDIEMETLENISREIRNSADIPPLDAGMAINNVNNITASN